MKNYFGLKKLASLRQLGLIGVFQKVSWRMRLILRIIWYLLFVKKICKSKVHAKDFVCIETPLPTFIIEKKEVEKLIRSSDSIRPEEKTRILRIANMAYKNEVWLRGIGERSIRLTKGTWYDYEHDVSLMLNRHDFLIALTQAHLITGQKLYSKKVNEFFNYWCDNFSVQQLRKRDKPIDAAIRLLNWIWVYNFCSLDFNDIRKKIFLYEIFLQLEYIKTYCSPGGNHLVLEALAVYVYGTLFQETSYGIKWKKWGKKILLEEMQRQVSADGIHTEQSMFYHQVVATHFLKFYLTAKRNKDNLESLFCERLQAMFEFVHQTMKPDLIHPMLGDGDLLTTDDREHWEAKLILGARCFLFKRPLYIGFVHALNDSLVWFLGITRNQVSTTEQWPESAIYPSTGIVTLRDQTNYLIFDAAKFGDPEFPHHGHADALSIELCAKGHSIFMDPGGYAYHPDQFRSYFRSTRAHNTILIDNKDQSQVFGVFGYGRLAQVSLGQCNLSAELDYAEAKHFGYKPIIHSRKIFFRKGVLPYVVVFDFITGAGEHEVKLNFHLAPQVTIDLEKCCIKLPDRLGQLSLWYFSSKLLLQEIVHGQKNGEIQGWISLRTSEVLPGDVWLVKGMVTLPLYIATVVAFEEKGITCEFSDSENTLKISASYNDLYKIDVQTSSVTLRGVTSI